MVHDGNQAVKSFAWHHRIRHYSLWASCRTKAETLARARELIAATTPAAKMQCNDEAAASREQPAHSS
jgi:hypothetical protein